MFKLSGTRNLLLLVLMGPHIFLADRLEASRYGLPNTPSSYSIHTTLGPRVISHRTAREKFRGYLDPRMGRHDYWVVALGVVIVLAFFAPKSQAYLNQLIDDAAAVAFAGMVASLFMRGSQAYQARLANQHVNAFYRKERALDKALSFLLDYVLFSLPLLAVACCPLYGVLVFSLVAMIVVTPMIYYWQNRKEHSFSSGLMQQFFIALSVWGLISLAPIGISSIPSATYSILFSLLFVYLAIRLFFSSRLDVLLLIIPLIALCLATPTTREVMQWIRQVWLTLYPHVIPLDVHPTGNIGLQPDPTQKSA